MDNRELTLTDLLADPMTLAVMAVHPKFASKNPEFNQLLGFDPNILTLPSLPVSRKLPVG